MGNSLRRVLLSSLEGCAVTSIKLDGVLHEFSTITGVKEDVTEIVLNMKSVVAKLYETSPKDVYKRQVLRNWPKALVRADSISKDRRNNFG